MLALSRKDGVALIILERPGTLSTSCIYLNICFIEACALVERSYIDTSIESVAIVETETK